MIEQIEADLKAALLARDELRTNVLKGIKNALKNESIAKQRELEPEEILVVIRREAKQRDEAAGLYEQGGSSDRAKQELAERAIIEKYLPAQLDEAAVKELIAKAAVELGNDPAKTGQIIGRVIQAANGQTDGQTVAKLVKQHFS